MRIIFCVLLFSICVLNLPNLNAQACLLSHYKFDDNVLDSKGGNHGTNHGTTPEKDRFGNSKSALRFVSSQSDYVSLPFAPFALQNYTYSVWIKMISLPSNGSAYIFLSVGGTGGDQNMQIENNQDNASLGYLTGFSLTTYNGNSSLRLGNAAGWLPVVNKWYHVVCSRDNNFVKVYVNGCLVATSAHSGGSLPFYGNSNKAATIGCRNNTSKFVDAVLDDVKIFNCALSAEEVSRLYTDYKPFEVTKDISVCLNSLSNLNLKATSGYCSYKWIDITDRKKILSTDSILVVNVNKTTIYRVFNYYGDSATVRVTIGMPKVNLGNDTSLCTIKNFQLKAGNFGAQYLWNTGQTTETININKKGKYIVKVTFNSNCYASDTINIYSNNTINLDLGGDTSFCNKIDFKLNACDSGANYLWNTGATSRSIQINAPGQYHVKANLFNGCTLFDTINIKIKNIPKQTLGNDTTICGNSDFILNACDSGKNYLWNTGANSKSLKIKSPGLYTVKVDLNNGCVFMDTIVVNQFKLPNLNLGNDTAFCGKVDMILKSIDSGLNYNWSTGETSKSINISLPGKYVVKVNLNNGCSLQDTININLNPLPTLNLGRDTSFCQGSTLSFDFNTLNGKLIWENHTNSKQYTINQSGTYTAKYIDNNNCEAYDTVVVDVLPKAVSKFNLNENLIKLDNGIVKIQNFASNFVSLKYDFGDGQTSDSLEPWHKYFNEGKYKIYQYAINSNGCNDTSINVVEVYDDFRIFVPDVFTPNDDEVNDIFKPIFTGISSDNYELLIYNRWGELLFKSNNPNVGWDGKYKGDYVNTDVFMYLIKLRTSRRIIHSFSGTFYILR